MTVPYRQEQRRGTSDGSPRRHTEQKGETIPISEYVRGIRARIGHDFLLLPGVTAVIRNGDAYLLARHRDTSRWSLIGGGVEPRETPLQALEREVLEEIGVRPTIAGVLGAYGGAALESIAPNGDRVGYVTVAYRCALPSVDLVLEESELIETRWFSREETKILFRHDWIDDVLRDDST